MNIHKIWKNPFYTNNPINAFSNLDDLNFIVWFLTFVEPFLNLLKGAATFLYSGGNVFEISAKGNLKITDSNKILYLF